MVSSSRFTPDDWLQLESVCDRFESERRHGKAADFRIYISQVDSRFRSRLTKELLRVDWDLQLECGTPPRQETYRDQVELTDRELEQLFKDWSAKKQVTGRIAHFSLTEKLGQGSFGTVWRATDTKLNREVALKVAHPSLANDADRILGEAKAAARLQHPAIVRILDAGEWDQHFCVVQEFVPGETLALQLKQRLFSFQESAKICQVIADALQYSHENSCVHRDLKPQNILMHGDAPKLIDFGLAKDFSAAAVETQSGTILGTPVYMSPEQARGASRTVDGRSDVYSLGVILFQMLTGELPFRGSLEMVVLQVLENDAPDPRQLNYDVPIDLSTICLKCLEKEPSRRYETALDLAEDLDRFLDGRSIKARPATSWYRFEKLIKRNRLATFLVVALLSLMVLGSSFAILDARRDALLAHENLRQERYLRQNAVEAQRKAFVSAENARREAKRAITVTSFLEDLIGLGDQVSAHVYTDSANVSQLYSNSLMNRALQRVQSELEDQPRTKARLLDIIANVYRSRGEFEKSEELLAQATLARLPVLVNQCDDEMNRDLAIHEFYCGCLFQSRGRYEESLGAFHASIQHYEEIVNSSPLKISEVYFQMGWLFSEWKRPLQSGEAFDQALKIRRQVLPESHRLIWTVRLAKSICQRNSEFSLGSIVETTGEMNLAKEVAHLVYLAWQIDSSRKSGDYAKAETCYRDALRILETMLAPHHPGLLLAKGDFASLLFTQGKYVEAMNLIKPLLKIGERLAPNHPQLIAAYRKIGVELCKAKRFDESITYLEKAVASKGPITSRLAGPALYLVSAFIALGDADRARQLLERIEIEPAAREMQVFLTIVEADLCHLMGEKETSIRLENEAYHAIGMLKSSYQAASWLRRFGQLCERVGDFESAEKYFQLALERDVEHRPVDHPRRADSQFCLGKLLARQGRFGEAKSWLQESLRIRKLQLPETDLRIVDCERWLERCASRKPSNL